VTDQDSPASGEQRFTILLNFGELLDPDTCSAIVLEFAIGFQSNAKFYNFLNDSSYLFVNGPFPGSMAVRLALFPTGISYPAGRMDASSILNAYIINNAYNRIPPMIISFGWGYISGQGFGIDMDTVDVFGLWNKLKITDNDFSNPKQPFITALAEFIVYPMSI
jgi:hypothetical protein